MRAEGGVAVERWPQRRKALRRRNLVENVAQRAEKAFFSCAPQAKKLALECDETRFLLTFGVYTKQDKKTTQKWQSSKRRSRDASRCRRLGCACSAAAQWRCRGCRRGGACICARAERAQRGQQRLRGARAARRLRRTPHAATAKANGVRQHVVVRRGAAAYGSASLQKK